MVPKVKSAILILLVLILPISFTGCFEEATQDSEPEVLIETAAEEILPEAELEVIARQGKKDRLPGSLKWGSIAMYKANEDFLADHPEGLKAVSSYNVQSTFSETSSGSTTTTTTVSSETGTGQGATGSEGSSSTTSVTTSGGGISTSVTVDGSLTMNETTTYDNGDSEWFNID